MRSDGSVFALGRIRLLGLGIGGGADIYFPVENIYLSNVSEIALGYESGLAFGQYERPPSRA